VGKSKIEFEVKTFLETPFYVQKLKKNNQFFKPIFHYRNFQIIKEIYPPSIDTPGRVEIKELDHQTVCFLSYVWNICSFKFSLFVHSNNKNKECLNKTPNYVLEITLIKYWTGRLRETVWSSIHPPHTY